MVYENLYKVLLYLWVLNILKDSEYYKIMNRLNKAHKDGKI